MEDTTEPLISCPGDTTVECGDSTDPSATGNASATDVCDSDPTITYSDETASSCGATEVITRTWQAEDDCGNVATCDQIITVEDTTEPLISCPGDTTVECGGDTSTNAQGVATATDDCGDVTITFDDAAVPGACGLTETITRTWTAEDECGNTATCDQTITVEDTTDPEITCPGDVTVECGDTSTNAAGVATATDDCGDVTITFSDDSVPGACGLTETITRTWTAEDVCGNTATCDQVITVEDTTDPEITCPGDTTVECGGDTGTNATGVATATDACGDVTVTFSDVSVPGVCGVTITRTWTAEDACGNAAACDQVITVADTTPPLLTVPSDTAVYCGESTATNITGLATAVDDCGTPPPPPVPSIWINEFHTDNSGTDTGEFVEVAGTAGFDLSGVQLVLYNGSGGAVYSNRTLSGVISNEGCGFGARSFSYPVNGIQNGSPDGLALAIGTQLVEFISYEGTFVGVGGPAAGVLSVDIGVTELGTDPPGLSLQKLGAGNSAGAFVWTNPAPQSPGLLNVGQTISPCFTGATGGLAVAFSDSAPSAGCPPTITRTWTSEDSCGNVATGLQLIALLDTNGPAITCPGDITVECGDDTSTNATGVATATDDCSGVVDVTFSDSSDPGVCGLTETITRTWTALDACSNISECVQTITVEDTTDPDITCPGDTTVECGDDTSTNATGVATASDACGDVTVNFSDSSAPGACGLTEEITRTWTAEDACGNTAECDQIITVDDTTDPTINCPSNVTITCGDSIDPFATGEATGSDNCGTVTASYSDSTSGYCLTGQTITRTWTVEDECGNTADCDQTITVQPTNIVISRIDVIFGTNVVSEQVFTNICPPATEYCDQVATVTVYEILGVVLEWPSVSDQTYAVEMTSPLVGTNWAGIPGASNLPGTPPANVYSNWFTIPTNRMGFFRVVGEAPAPP